MGLAGSGLACNESGLRLTGSEFNPDARILYQILRAPDILHDARIIGLAK